MTSLAQFASGDWPCLNWTISMGCQTFPDDCTGCVWPSTWQTTVSGVTADAFCSDCPTIWNTTYTWTIEEDCMIDLVLRPTFCGIEPGRAALFCSLGIPPVTPRWYIRFEVDIDVVAEYHCLAPNWNPAGPNTFNFYLKSYCENWPASLTLTRVS